MSDVCSLLIAARGLRLREVVGNAMAPLFQPGDTVVLAPVYAFEGSGILRAPDDFAEVELGRIGMVCHAIERAVPAAAAGASIRRPRA